MSMYVYVYIQVAMAPRSKRKSNRGNGAFDTETESYVTAAKADYRKDLATVNDGCIQSYKHRIIIYEKKFFKKEKH